MAYQETEHEAQGIGGQTKCVNSWEWCVCTTYSSKRKNFPSVPLNRVGQIAICAISQQLRLLRCEETRVMVGCPFPG